MKVNNKHKRRLSAYCIEEGAATKHQSAAEVIERVKDEQIKTTIYLNYLKDVQLEDFENVWENNYKALKGSMAGRALPLSVQQVAALLFHSLKSIKIAQLFKEQEIDGQAFINMQKADLDSLKLPFIDSIRIATLVEKMRADTDPTGIF